MDFKLSSLAAPVRWMRTAYGFSKNAGAHIRLNEFRVNNREFICKMQGQLALMLVNSSERHKQLRILYEEYQLLKKRDGSSAEDIDSARERVRASVEAVDSFVVHKLLLASEAIYESLEEHCRVRLKDNTHRPRFCIKLRNDGKIFTLSRSNGAKIHQSDKSDESFQTVRRLNSGFDYVSRTGMPYFKDSLVTEAKKGLYSNPRLNSGAVARYDSSSWTTIKNKLSAQPTADEDWINCWVVTNNGRPSAAECYKSTIIVPINLKHSQIDSEFIDIFKLKHHSLANEDSKYQFGYLCADCHEEDFFERYDVDFMYACADLFSLFLIVSRNFREASGTYAAARGILKSATASEQTPGRKSRRSRSPNFIGNQDGTNA